MEANTLTIKPPHLLFPWSQGPQKGAILFDYSSWESLLWKLANDLLQQGWKHGEAWRDITLHSTSPKRILHLETKTITI
jgi:hypothetical protein